MNSSRSTKSSLNIQTGISAPRLLSVKVVVLLLLTLGLFLLLVKLGMWQLDRGQQKQRLEQQLYDRSLALPVPLQTVMDDTSMLNEQQYYGLNISAQLSPSDKPALLLDNQTLDGKVGYLVYQPMYWRVDQHTSQLVLVDLGFVVAPPRREQLPYVELLTQVTDLSARLYSKSINHLSEQQSLEVFQQGSMDLLRVQSINPGYLSSQWQQSVWPVFIQPTSLNNWSQPMVWKPFPMSSQKHFGYAVQWFAMAGVFMGLMVWVGWQFGLNRNKADKEVD
jgi:cytochrome oxidase assembly protein ShyY1